MRIGIDCRMAGTGEGIGRYVEQLVSNLVEMDRTNEYFLLVNEISNLKFLISKQIPNPNFKIIKVKSKYYSLMEQTYFILELLRLRLDLVHFASFNAPIFYPGKFVVTIHDIIHHKFPGRKKSRLLHRLAYRLTIWAAVKRAKMVIAVSEVTRGEIIKAFRVSPQKIKVIYEGAEAAGNVAVDSESVLKKYGITKPFILFVGVWRQYKNLPALARAFDILKEKYAPDALLVLAGKIDPYYPEIQNEVLSIKNKTDLRTPGFVSEEDLAVLYKQAKVFVLPSLIEGFGLVGVEAQAAGVPVAASDIPVLREVLGTGAVYFDPNDTADMAEKIHEAWNRVEASDNFKRFTWEMCALQTKKMYEEALR